MNLNQSLPVEWVDIDDPNPKRGKVRGQGHSKGAALFARGEGLWLHQHSAYFTATSGGPIGEGQVFKFTPTSKNEGKIEVLCHSVDTYLFERPDALSVAPKGDVWVAEDNMGTNCIRCIKPDGTLHYFAQNVLSKGELSGVCFDESGSTMYVNLQDDGLTIAIRGPFANYQG